MKIESISIQHFKLFNQLEVSFKHKTLEEDRSQFLIHVMPIYSLRHDRLVFYLDCGDTSV